MIEPALEVPSEPIAQKDTLLTRRNFLGLAAGSVAGVALYAAEISRHEIEVIPKTIHLSALPDAFAGLKIVQISDFHYAEYTEAFFLERVVRRVNDLAPDLVLLTGDFVSRGPLPLPFAARMSYHCAEILSRIACPLRYAIMGNHDALVSVETVPDALTMHGIPVLANSFIPLERDGGRLWLAGIEDVLQQRPDLSRALPATRNVASEPLILMAHEPDFADYAIGRKIDLVLSGHTHGGQVRIPLLPPLLLPDMGVLYVHGHFRMRDGMQLYVNRGIGAVNLPFRFRCPPEITVFTLQPPAQV